MPKQQVGAVMVEIYPTGSKLTWDVKLSKETEGRHDIVLIPKQRLAKAVELQYVGKPVTKYDEFRQITSDTYSLEGQVLFTTSVVLENVGMPGGVLGDLKVIELYSKLDQAFNELNTGKKSFVHINLISKAINVGSM
jgi:hypothetical protein